MSNDKIVLYPKHHCWAENASVYPGDRGAVRECGTCGRRWVATWLGYLPLRWWHWRVQRQLRSLTTAPTAVAVDLVEVDPVYDVVKPVVTR